MHDCGSQEDLVAWAEIPWSSCDSENSSRMRLLPPDHQTYRPTRLLKVSGNKKITHFKQQIKQRIEAYFSNSKNENNNTSKPNG